MKKKIIFIGICLLSHFVSFAQFQKHNFKAGLTFNLFNNEPFIWQPGLTNNYQEKQPGFNLTPSIGVFVSDKFELGIKAGFNQSKSIIETSSYTSNSKENIFSTLLYGNQYFNLSEKISPFLMYGLGFDFSSYHNNTDYATGYHGITDEKGFAYSLFISPGLSYIPARKLIISSSFGSLGYRKEINRDKATNDIVSKYNTYGAYFNLNSFQIGIHYIF